MKKILKTAALAALLAMTLSCEFVGGLLHDDDVVAKLGRRKLYRSQLESFIPAHSSPEDSARLALQYINTWATEQLFQDVAQQQLSKSEQDVTKELEDYRRSLLKYRYEQRFINERLDTVVALSEVEEYYEAHKDLFVLRMPIVKARFLDIVKDSPALETLKKKMSSSDYEDLAEADSIAYKAALKYEDRSDDWQDISDYARNFGVDYGTLLSKLQSSGFVEIDDEKGDVKIGYVSKIIRQGVAPLEYCEPRIQDIIVSARKHELLVSLERDLLNDALDHKQLIIY